MSLELIEDIVLILCVPAMVFYLRSIHLALADIANVEELRKKVSR